jgi:hypothetical protein
MTKGRQKPAAAGVKDTDDDTQPCKSQGPLPVVIDESPARCTDKKTEISL